MITRQCFRAVQYGYDFGAPNSRIKCTATGLVSLSCGLRHITNTVGKAVDAACQWGIISVLARTGPPDLVGQYALGVAISGPLLLLMRPESRSTRAADIRVLALVFAILGVAAVGFLDPSTHQRLSMLLVAMAQIVEWLAQMYHGRRDGLSLILHGGLSVAVLAFGGGLLGVLTVRVLVLVLYDLRQPRFNDGLGWREPVLPSLVGYVPCYFIAHMSGFRSLGVYAAMASLLPVLDVLAGALKEEAGRRWELAGTVTITGIAAVVGAMVWGRAIIELLFGNDYTAGVGLLIALAIAGALASLAGTIEAQPSTSFEMLIIATVAIGCIAFVPRFGLPGAAMSLGLGAMTRMARSVSFAADTL